MGTQPLKKPTDASGKSGSPNALGGISGLTTGYIAQVLKAGGQIDIGDAIIRPSGSTPAAPLQYQAGYAQSDLYRNPYSATVTTASSNGMVYVVPNVAAPPIQGQPTNPNDPLVWLRRRVDEIVDYALESVA